MLVTIDYTNENDSIMEFRMFHPEISDTVEALNLALQDMKRLGKRTDKIICVWFFSGDVKEL